MKLLGTLSSSLVNGDGVRYVVFCQGCSHHCPGCHNPDSWDFNGGFDISVEALARDILRHDHIDGVTLSGGDPFFQHDEYVKLLAILPSHFNIWIYTGFDYSKIRNTELARMADVVVDGLYIEKLRVEGKPYGSSNQRIIRKGKRFNYGKA